VSAGLRHGTKKPSLLRAGRYAELIDYELDDIFLPGFLKRCELI
jgi:hypothetical protein